MIQRMILGSGGYARVWLYNENDHSLSDIDQANKDLVDGKKRVYGKKSHCLLDMSQDKWGKIEFSLYPFDILDEAHLDFLGRDSRKDPHFHGRWTTTDSRLLGSLQLLGTHKFPLEDYFVQSGMPRLLLTLDMVRKLDWSGHSKQTPPALSSLLKHYELLAQLKSDADFWKYLETELRLGAVSKDDLMQFASFQSLVTYLSSTSARPGVFLKEKGWLPVLWFMPWEIAREPSYLIEYGHALCFSNQGRTGSKAHCERFPKLPGKVIDTLDVEFEHIPEADNLKQCFDPQVTLNKTNVGYIVAGPGLNDLWVEDCPLLAGENSKIFSSNSEPVPPPKKQSDWIATNFDGYLKDYSHLDEDLVDFLGCLDLFIADETKSVLSKVSRLSTAYQTTFLFLGLLVLFYLCSSTWLLLNNIARERMCDDGLLSAFGVPDRKIHAGIFLNTIIGFTVATLLALLVLLMSHYSFFLLALIISSVCILWLGVSVYRGMGRNRGLIMGVVKLITLLTIAIYLPYAGWVYSMPLVTMVTEPGAHWLIVLLILLVVCISIEYYVTVWSQRGHYVNRKLGRY